MRDETIIAPLLVTREEAARLLGICDRSVDALIRAGELPAVKFGRAVRVDVNDLRRLIEQKKAGDAVGVAR